MVKSCWIVDLGASSHVCYDANMMMTTYRLDKLVIVHLPDGSVKPVTFGGDARISKEVFLKDVLTVPGYINNLIFVAQLIKDSGVKFTFLPTHCIIQKQENDKILGIAKMVHNLYVIDTAIEKHFYNIFDPREMTIQDIPQ